MQKRIPLPNGTTIWVSPSVTQGTFTPPVPTDPSWIEVQRVTALTHSGGDEKFSIHSPLGSYEDVRTPAGRNLMDIQLSFEDAPGSAFVTAIELGRDSRAALAWKFKLPGGQVSIVFSGYASGSMIPVLDRNQLMVIAITIAVIGTPKRITG
ncbi:phage tail tube protein [Pseudomonas lundensis]|uniref:phage tail tube protein n=1 Tax=Pseudomonas lundensis TaxID=86185 RepID=UPI0009F40C32|nr:phage tail tube protein [Pseudomonas lundensis]